ncbi:helix-turn-helix domain-containing protein [Fulvivirga kasyanovii]|uniref:IS1 family transposase n=1 Tax=Fulvivirga kasyanovii TaxID=396812 RepID=A0ABW9RHU4_9BACT|nr:helix-turn-helix domain-containing protein [Fulvivirga kasyanovii]MTI23485.1 IS1 family transposase [Fulvivirga kasyanovii]
MHIPQCPKCGSQKIIKSGVVNNRQRFHCKKCSYYFTINKLGKKIDDYYVIKALQLYLEGVSLREIERLLGVSHVSVMNWVRKYNIKAPERYDYRPTYQILNHQELQEFISKPTNMGGSGMLITELGDKFMLIKWERFKD